MSPLAGLVVLAQAQAALDAAKVCYHALDYVCADEQLAVALAAGLPREAQVEARLYEALLALARRDEAGARAALRALLALDPAFNPGPRANLRLRELLETERPAPPPPLAVAFRADVSSIRLAGQDADRWSEGLGFELAAGAFVLGRFGVELAVGYSDHRPRTFVLEGLTLWTVGATGLLPFRAGPVDLSPFVSLSAAHVEVEGVTGGQAYWGGVGGLGIDVRAELIGGLGIGARAAVSVLAADDEGRAALSFLLPLAAGIRYAF